MFAPGTPGASGAFAGSSSPWDSQERNSHGRSPTRRILGDSSGAEIQTPSKIMESSAIANMVDIDELVKVGTFDELAPSFVLTTDREHDELDMEPEEVIDKTVAVSAQIESNLKQSFRTIMAKVVASSISYTEDEEDSAETGPPVTATVNGRAKMAVADTFCEMALDRIEELISPQLDLVVQEYYQPLVDATLKESTNSAKAQCLLKFHQAIKEMSQVEQATASNAVAETETQKSQAEVTFNGCLAKMRKLYESYMQVKLQYDDEMREVAKISDSLHLSSQQDSAKAKQERDKQVEDFAQARKRAEALKSIMEFKFESIIQCIYNSYPDIAGSASSSSSKKGYALHEYKLPSGILGDTHDAKIASSMIAGLLQIAQAWIEDFFVLVIFLKRIQDNESPFSPVFAPLIEDMPRILGKDLGELAVQQMGKMWSVVARGSVTTVMSAILGSSGASWNALSCTAKA